MTHSYLSATVVDKMTSMQQQLRERIVQFYEKHKDEGKKSTCLHFLNEGVPKSTIYSILNTLRIERQPGSGRKATIMTRENLKVLKSTFNDKDGRSQRQAAKKFNCSQPHICKSLKKIGIKARKKQRSPEYSDEQIQRVKSQCRWMCRNYNKKSLILDDESYFSLSAPQMPGNDIYYTNDTSKVSPDVKFRYKKKFERKVMLYIAVSERGISEPYFKPSGLAINQEIYQNQCLKKILLPYIQKYHRDENYVFWPDKASSHYAKKTLEFLDSKNIPYVPKEQNPTNLPQCRPIEDFFGELKGLVYKNGWRAKNTKQLTTRIKKCLKEIDTNGVQRACAGVVAKLRRVADIGPYDQVH